MSLPVVAIVGRPNVGKSTLFNRIIGQRVSIVENIPGVTRDRIYQKAEWLDTQFNLVDTGGIVDFIEDGTLEEKIRVQAEIAIEEADLIIFLVDSRDGLVADDFTITDILRRTAKPIVLVANKVENYTELEYLNEFFSLGLGEPLPISAAHGMNIGDLLDKVIEKLPKIQILDEDAIRIAIVGRPNVGKSSLVNCILGEERIIVSDLPGTTRDSIDSLFEREGQKYILIDTAGIRRKSRIHQSTERYSVIRSLKAIEECQVALIIIDATEGVTEQDKRIAGLVDEAGKASVLVVNKWDLVNKDSITMRSFERKLREDLGFMYYAPTVYISAVTGQRIGNLLETIDLVDSEAMKRFNTRILNQYLDEITGLNPPPSEKGRKIKFSYVTQGNIRPPTFVFFVNYPKSVHFSYRRYLENKFREAFSFTGNPIRFIFKEKK